MSKIAIVYWSGTGNTESMARLVAEGVAAGGGRADLLTAPEFTPDRAGGCAAIALGCPSMGAERLEEEEFEPMFEAVKPSLNQKPVALFGSYGWGDGEWMRAWEADCRAAGCRLVSEPVIVSGAPDGAVSDACRALGEALAKA